MKKRPSKRRLIARFMQGKWVGEYDMTRYDLDFRLGKFAVEFNEMRQAVRKIKGGGDE